MLFYHLFKLCCLWMTFQVLFSQLIEFCHHCDCMIFIHYSIVSCQLYSIVIELVVRMSHKYHVHCNFQAQKIIKLILKHLQDYLCLLKLCNFNICFFNEVILQFLCFRCALYYAIYVFVLWFYFSLLCKLYDPFFKM